MVPNDLRKSNLTVDDVLLVRGHITTPEINTGLLTCTHLIVTTDATIPNIDGGGTVPTNIVLTVGDQTINGVKTFTSSVPITAISDQLTLGNITLNVNPAVAPRIYTVVDVGTDADFVMSAGIQTINGAKTFTSTLVDTLTSNQIELGTGNTVTINAVAPSASRTYSIQDAGANANFVMSEGAQTINGAKTLTDTTTFGTGILLPTSGGTPSLLDYYEALTGTLVYTCNAFVGSRNVNFQIVRSGAQVVFFSDGLPTEAASGAPGLMLAPATPIPSQFLPTATVTGAILTFASVTSNSVRVVGTFRVSQGGNFSIAAGAAEGTTFAATGNLGFNPFVSSWTIPGPSP